MINQTQIDNIAAAYTEKLILPSNPLKPMWNRENFVFNKPPKWNYIDATIIKAVSMLYELSGDERLFDFAENFADSYVTETGEIPTMRFSDFNLDNINGARNLIWLYKNTQKEKYRLAFENFYCEQIKKQPRLSCGNFWHKAIYPNQIWLDGAYMAMPFLAEYSIYKSDSEPLDDIFCQLGNIRRIMLDKNTGLYYHAYDETRTMYWSDKVTGLSSQFWLRSIGWLCAALADLCSIIHKNAKLYALCSAMLYELLERLVSYTDDDGMLFQLPAKPALKGNYKETSGTLLFSYSSIKSGRLGICPDFIKNAGIEAFNSVTNKYIDLNEEIPRLKNICLVAGLGGFPKRDGSAEYYLNEKIVENDAKGIAPWLMAYTEVKKIIKP